MSDPLRIRMICEGHTDKYREVARVLVAGWEFARKLSQAQRFEEDLRGALSLVSPVEVTAR